MTREIKGHRGISGARQRHRHGLHQLLGTRETVSHDDNRTIGGGKRSKNADGDIAEPRQFDPDVGLRRQQADESEANRGSRRDKT